MLRAGNIAGYLLLLVLALVNYAGASDKLDEFDAMSSEEQVKFAKKKCRNKDGYDICKIGRYTIYSEVGPVKAYRWGLILDNYTDESIADGIFPSKLNKRGTPPQVFFLRGRGSYDRKINEIFQITVPQNSAAVFMRDGKKAGLFMYYDDNGGGEDFKIDAESDAQIQECTLHEATHQMVYYHIHTDVPTWFNEGLAMNMETYNTSMGFKANLHNSMYVNNRAISACNIAFGGGRLVSFPQLFDMNHRTWNEDMDRGRGQENYTSAWLACNFFFTCKKGRKFTGKFIQALKAGGADKANKMLSAKAINAIDDDIQEHLKKVILPCVKYGRELRQLIQKGDLETAKRGLDMMMKEFPDSTEGKFYEQWLAILNEDKPTAAITELQKIVDADDDFYHPEMNYVLALGYFKSGDSRNAKKYIDKARKDNSRSEQVKELKEKIK